MERIQAYDLSGQFVYDPERALDYATEITFSTMAPKGNGEASFKVKRSDIFADWLISESYGVIIYDGATIVYDGRIETMPKDISGADEYITVRCVGWAALFLERDLRKRWVDIKGISHLRWPDGLENNVVQTTFVNTKRDNVLQVFLGTGDIERGQSTYRELYELPSGTVRKVLMDYVIRSGEGFFFAVHNVSNPAGVVVFSPGGGPLPGLEWYVVSTSTVVSGSADITFALGPTRTFEIHWRIENPDLYDQNDYAHPSNLRVEANYETGHSTAIPTYSQGELVEDVVLLVNQKGAHISTDFSQLGDPGLILDPFAVEEPTYAGSVIEKIASYGDAALNTWLWYVWDRSDTSDGLPRFVFSARSVADYEYQAELSAAELAGLNYEKISEGLYNNSTVQYIDERDTERYRTALDNAALKDTASIAAEYQRDYYLKLGHADTTRADYLGSRFIEYHKDRVTRGTITLKGFVTQKDGSKVPANRVRAGQRIKLLNTNEIFFIRHTSYDAETQTVRISPDQPQDNIAMLFVQRERNMGRLA